MPRHVDPPRLIGRAVIHPDDDVALGIAGGADGQRTAAPAQHDQRAGRIEADAGDGGRRHAGLPDGPADGEANGAPDVVARLLDDLAGLAEEGNFVPRRPDQPARPVEHAGTRAAGPDVDAEEISASGGVGNGVAHLLRDPCRMAE